MSNFLGTCASCGDDCSSPGCVQQKIYTALVRGCSGCSDLSNAVAFVNANFSSISPLSLAWGSHAVGWQYAILDTFDAPADTTPDLADRSTFDGLIGSGFEYENVSIASVDGPGTGLATRTAFLLPDSTAYVVGSWYDSGNGYVWQNACTMTGMAVGCGYVFDIPIPPIDLCASSESASSGAGGPDYNVFTTSTYGGTFADFVWSTFYSAHHSDSDFNPGITATPDACLSPDPFFGDDPP